MSRDGSVVVFGTDDAFDTTDTNGTTDIYLRDRVNRETSRVSIAENGDDPDGASSYPQISSDGRYVSFESRATNLVPGDTNEITDFFVKDLQTGRVRRVSLDDGGRQVTQILSGLEGILAASGRFVVFTPRDSLDSDPAAGIFIVELSDGFWNSPPH